MSVAAARGGQCVPGAPVEMLGEPYAEPTKGKMGQGRRLQVTQTDKLPG